MHERHSFFTPPCYATEQGVILAPVYNLAQTLLKRSGEEHLFVPIRSMQVLAIIEPKMFWFIDSLAYAVQDGEGGRLVTVSWKPLQPPSERESLEQPMPCEISFYGKEQREVQLRLNTEFMQAMKQLDQRYRDHLPSSQRPKILPFTVPQ